MTTDTYNTVIAHTTDAEFRAWGLALHNSIMTHATIANAGDTGQIDFATVTRPAVGVSGGYKIYYLNDSLHGTAPVYIKLEFGTAAGGAAIPSIWITVGIGTNGAGTLNPTLLTSRQTCTRSGGPTSAIINYPTFTCSVAGYLGLSFKRGAQTSQGYGGFHVCRSVDASGVISAEGVDMFFCPGTAAAFVQHQLRFSPAVGRVPSANTYCLVAARVTADTGTPVGLDKQAYKYYSSWPRQRCNPFLCAAYIGDIPLDTVFSDIPVAAVTRTYRMMGDGFAFGDGSATPLIQGCMLWE